MTFRRIDKNQKEITNDLRKMGFSVLILSSVGDGCGDILVGKNNLNFLFEIKSSQKAKLTPHQIKFFESWRGNIHRIHSVDEIIKIVNNIEQK